MRFATTPQVVLAGLLMLMSAGRSEAAPFSFDFFANQQGWSGSWLSTGGNPGGFLAVTQVADSGAGTGSFTLGVGPSITISPAPFAAADAAATLFFDNKVVSATTNTHDFGVSEVRLFGTINSDAFFIVYSLSVPLGTNWTTIGVPLSSATSLVIPGGAPPSLPVTQANLETFLPLVTTIFLLDQFSVDRGTGPVSVTFGFDNVRLVGATTAPPANPAVPEPTTLLLLGTGLGAVAARRRGRSR